MSDRLSVLTLTKGRHTHLARLIEGLERSNCKPWELIVVDMADNWTDLPTPDFRVRVIPMPSTGLPLAAARNAAAAVATSSLLLFLDVDCIPTRHLTAVMAGALAQERGIICPEVRYLTAGESASDVIDDAAWAKAQPHPVRHFPTAGQRRELNPGLFWSLVFGIKRAVFMQLGGFDESFSGYGAEDTDFGFRANAAGVPLYFMGGVGALHQHHAVFDPPLQHFDDIVQNSAIFFRKWHVWPMRGWLDQFQALGLIEMSAHAIDIRRRPTTAEITAAQVDRPF